MADAVAQLDAALDAFEPAIAEQARAALAFFRERFPNAHLLAYDNYNALAIGFASGEKQSTIAFSVTLYPRWVSLFFTSGTELVDPAKLLVGTGTRIRHVVLTDGLTHEEDAVLGLVDQAIANLEPPVNPNEPGRLIMKSISPKKRPRRPQSQ
ncbi:MAG: hypothetical protein AAF127_07910 [Pseudomonadota bacterium]